MQVLRRRLAVLVAAALLAAPASAAALSAGDDQYRDPFAADGRLILLTGAVLLAGGVVLRLRERS